LEKLNTSCQHWFKRFFARHHPECNNYISYAGEELLVLVIYLDQKKGRWI
jgi:hypothetical protein